MMVGNLSKCQSYDALRCCLCSLLVKLKWLFVGILLTQENNFLDCPKSLQSFMRSRRTACSKRQHSLVLHGNGPCLFIQRGTLTHRAPSECRRSSLHLRPSACRILAPDQTPQMTTLSPKRDAHKDRIRNVLFRRALNASFLKKKKTKKKLLNFKINFYTNNLQLNEQME